MYNNKIFLAMDYKNRTISEQTGLYLEALTSLETTAAKVLDALEMHYGDTQGEKMWQEKIVEHYLIIQDEIFSAMGNSIVENLNLKESKEI